MGWTTIGDYLGREVRLRRFESPNVFEVGGNLASSVVLVFSCGALSNPDEMKPMLSSLLKMMPLAVAFGGSDSRLAFDGALEILSRMREGPHTMTKLSSATDCVELIEDFLQATWPAEERFAEWKTYSVLVFGSVELSDELWHAVEVVAQ
jgi:hypothetical protein